MRETVLGPDAARITRTTRYPPTAGAAGNPEVEYERLTAALAALGRLHNETAEVRPRRPREAPKAQTQPAQRRPRGANREVILTVVGERAGVTAADIAQATGIEKNVVYSTLGKLVRGGVVEAFALPSGRKGHRIAAARPESDLGS